MKTCKICNKKLSWNNTSGYCKEHKKLDVKYCFRCGKAIKYSTTGLCSKCNKYGKNNPKYRNGKYTSDGHIKRCECCGIEISIHAIRCKKCNSLFNNAMQGVVGENNPRWTRISKECDTCGKEIFVTPSILKNTKQQFCSKNCFNKSISARVTGKNNPFYGKQHSLEVRKKTSLRMGGTGIPFQYSDYGNKFTYALKKKIRERDNYTCQVCGLSEKNHGKKLAVHHIDYDKKNSSEDNLIALCEPCHLRTNPKKNRLYWQEYFRNKVITRGLL